MGRKIDPVGGRRRRTLRPLGSILPAARQQHFGQQQREAQYEARGERQLLESRDGHGDPKDGDLPLVGGASGKARSTDRIRSLGCPVYRQNGSEQVL